MKRAILALVGFLGLVTSACGDKSLTSPSTVQPTVERPAQEKEPLDSRSIFWGV
jgi:hypothetical protein